MTQAQANRIARVRLSAAMALVLVVGPRKAA
jgi:hypothetical protein